jgi:hypothetical protein
VENLEKSKKLIYNENKGKLAQEEIFKLSEDEFYDYLSSQKDESISDDEIILNYKKGTEKLIQEIRKFHDNMATLVINNKISLRNKFNFIMDLLKVENKEEVFPLLICFICDIDYIFNLKKIIVKEKSKRNLARYLRLKEKMGTFLEKHKFIKEQEKDYESFIKQVLKKDKADEGEELSNEKREILKKLFMEYVESNIDETQFYENLEHIHKFSTSTEERKAIYPNLIFKLFTKYKSKIAKKTFIITNKSILNYMGYKIEEDNYKNFPTNKKYIMLFFELCNEFCEDKDLKLNLFVFEKCSNLGKWYWLQDDKNIDFCYSYESLFETSYSKYNSIFPDKSRYYENEQHCRGIECTEEEDGNEVKKEIPEDEYIDSFIEQHLEEVMTEPREYLNEYIKGKNKAESYVEKSAQEIMRYVEEEFRKNFYFIRHFYWCMEGAFRAISDCEVQKDIVKFIREIEI